MPIFGAESDAMRMGAMGPGMGGAPQEGPQPGPSEMALANQVYQLQHMVMQLQQQIADMKKNRFAMEHEILRDNDGRASRLISREMTLE